MPKIDRYTNFDDDDYLDNEQDFQKIKHKKKIEESESEKGKKLNKKKHVPRENKE